MDNNKCKWLPPLTQIIRGETSEQYLQRLYTIFNDNHNLTHPVFLGKVVLYDTNYPLINNREEQFYHLTTQDDHSQRNAERKIDYARSERISWIKAVIEHFDCNEGCCDGIKIWRDKKKIKILFEKEKYIVVLKVHSSNYHLITAFYINYPHELKKLLKQYEEYKNIPLK